MGIIERLGITPGPWTCEHRKHIDIKGDEWYSTEVYSNEKNEDYICRLSWLGKRMPDNSIKSMRSEHGNLIAAAPEMLEALIDMLIEAEKLYTQFCRNDFEEVYKTKITIIKKATGKTWAEIKEITK